MGGILISTVAKRGRVNRGGIGWYAYFCKRHLAEKRGYVYHLVPAINEYGGWESQGMKQPKPPSGKPRQGWV